MYVAAASASATFTADEIVVETTLGGGFFRLAGFNKTINLATTGVGGMDTGTAPANGYVALYAIYNPSTATQSLLAVNATTGKVSEVYGGGNMPAGYTASALVSVWPTNGSGQLVAGYQNGRTFYPVSTAIFSTTTTVTSYTSLNISNAVPPNAIKFGGISIAQATNPTSSIGASLAASSAGVGGQTCQAGGYSGTGQTDSPFTIPLITQQTMYYTFVAPGGTSPSLTIYSSSYEF
ncbi:phage tail protein [Burkholderia cenocepacia]|nr:phage tail protein [Burkholderia cenocepacia]